MNGITYGVIVEEYTLNGKTRVAYGVAAYANEDMMCVVASAHNLSCERCQLETLVDKCNRGNLSICHLPDIIDDFLKE